MKKKMRRNEGKREMSKSLGKEMKLDKRSKVRQNKEVKVKTKLDKEVRS